MVDSSESSSTPQTPRAEYNEHRKEEYRRKYRELAEDALAYNFSRVWERSVVAMNQRSLADPETDYLTKREKYVMDLSNYRKFFFGMAAGSATFGLIVGVNMMRKHRHLITSAVVPKRPKVSYTNLDRIAGKRQPIPKKPKKTENGPSRKHQPVLAPQEVYDGPAWSEVFKHIELVLTSAVALVVGGLCSFFVDETQMYRDFGKLPLEPGKSYLCHKGCPEMMRHYIDVILKPTTPTYTWQNVESDGTASMMGPDMNAEMFQGLPADILPSDQEMWEYPQSEKLESMVRLISNCEQRMQYEMDERRKKALLLEFDDWGGPVDIPEPGVPQTYLGIEVREDDDEGEEDVSTLDVRVMQESLDQPPKRWWRFW